MARPHIELIDQHDYLWHPAELPESEGRARQQNLSYDEEDGSASTRVHFDTDWGRPGGSHHADTEWFVLDGEIQIGDRRFGKGGYIHAPKGAPVPPMRAVSGTEVLLYREYGDWGFDTGAPGEPAAAAQLTVHDTQAMEWEAVETGSPAKDTFDIGAPVVGLKIKLLYRDANSGFYTRLIHASPDWTEHPLAHHPCFEEAYTLAGSMEYNYGSLYPGTYFFRPARIRHGNFRAGPEGTTWLIRSDGELINLYTEGATVEMHGTPLNYGPGQQVTLEPMLPDPVRSTATRDWQRVER